MRLHYGGSDQDANYRMQTSNNAHLSRFNHIKRADIWEQITHPQR